MSIGSNELADMKVTFVVPARNEERDIGGCVDALLVQTGDFAAEIIVVDNGSIDATAQRARTHGARVVYEERAGLANARLAGLNAARGEILVFVDADTRLPPHWTRDAIALFDADEKLAGISPEFRFHDGRVIDDIGNFLFRNFLSPLTNLVLRATGRPGVLVGSTIAVRTEALRRANGPDPEFQFYGEDTMLAVRLHTQGDVRFVRQPALYTSARRYQQRGLLPVVYRYFLVFALIHLGRVQTASRLARRFHECDRREPGDSRCRAFFSEALRPHGYGNETAIMADELTAPEQQLPADA